MSDDELRQRVAEAMYTLASALRDKGGESTWETWLSVAAIAIAATRAADREAAS